MPRRLTLDTSVFVAGLRKQEEFHVSCKALVEKVVKGEFIALEPYTVLVEIAAAVTRRSGSSELSAKITRDLQETRTIFFFDLDASRTKRSTEIARKTSVRGMDAIVAEIAQEFEATLVSLDTEMLEKVAGIVECRMPTEVL